MLPNPYPVLRNALWAFLGALEGIAARAICYCKHCLYAPFFVASRTCTKHGFLIHHYTYVCTRCGKPRTVTSGRHAAFRRRANISWDNTDPRPRVGRCVPPR